MDPPSSNSDASSAFPITDVDFEGIKVIGRGAYGAVYLFRRKEGIYCAGKFVDRSRFTSPDNAVVRAAFERAYSGLLTFLAVTSDSDHLLHIIHHGRHDDEGYFYYMMELADDIDDRPFDPETYHPRTLDGELERNGSRRRIPPRKCIEMAISLARALKVLHDCGLVHRDVRPANVIFARGQPKLADIDLVGEADATLTSYIPREYAAPEGSHNKRADIFSFGKTLYEMCTGLPVRDFPRLPPDVRDWEDYQIVQKLNKVIRKACAPALEKRYISVRRMLRDLERIEKGGSPVPDTPFLALWIGIAVVSLVAAAFFTASFLSPRQPDADSPLSLITQPAGGSRLPVPGPPEIVSARRQIEATSPPPIQTSLPEQRSKYAVAILDGASEADTPASMFARAEIARDGAIGAGDYQTALRACEKISTTFAVNPREFNAMKAASLAKLVDGVVNPATFRAMSKTSTQIGFESLAMDDFESAQSLAATASKAATIANDRLLEGQAAFLADEVTRCVDAHKRIERLARRLAKDPDNPRANAAGGKYLCFFKNAWTRGLPMLQKAPEVKLAELASRDLATPTSPLEQILLGDQWWALADSAKKDERFYYRLRAKYWYAKSLDGLAKAAKPLETSQAASMDHAEARYSEFFTEFPPKKATLRLKINVEGGASLVIDSEQMVLNNSHGARNVSINDRAWGSFSPGGPNTLPNYGASRFCPDLLDFSKATITQSRKSREEAKVGEFKATKGYIKLGFVDWPAGSADFDLVISF